jgi:hypothetical protein
MILECKNEFNTRIATLKMKSSWMPTTFWRAGAKLTCKWLRLQALYIPPWNAWAAGPENEVENRYK